MTVRPERRGEFLESVNGMKERSRLEPGCISCRFYQDFDHKNTFAFIEEWESWEDLDDHIRLETFRMLVTVMDILSEPPEVLFNAVSHTAGLEAISAAFEKGRDEKKTTECC